MHTALLPKHHELSGEASKPVDDNVEQVDVRQLTRAQKQLLIQKALATQEQDNGEFVRKIRERLDRYVQLCRSPRRHCSVLANSVPRV